MHGPLGLRGVPRTPDNPGNYSCFGLADDPDDGEAKLTGRMRHRLRLAVWPLAEECPYKLEDLEKNVVRRLQPPLNLAHVSHDELMASEAREDGAV